MRVKYSEKNASHKEKNPWHFLDGGTLRIPFWKLLLNPGSHYWKAGLKKAPSAWRASY